MEHVAIPVPPLVTQPMAGADDGLFVSAASTRPARNIPAPFVGLRWRFVSDPIQAGRPHVQP